MCVGDHLIKLAYTPEMIGCADAALDKIGFGRFQWITLILSGIGFGAATVELVAVSQIKSFIQGKWDLGTRELGYMSTATFIGEVFGGIIWAQLSDACGREKVFLATSSLMFFFSLILPFCTTFSQFCWTRLFLGFAIGGGLSVDFVYFIECVPPRNRSFRSAFIIFIGILGVMYSAGCGLLLLQRYGYETFLVVCSVPSAALLMGRMLWRFESPKYLVAKGRIGEAERLLAEIARINGCKDATKFELSLSDKTNQDSSSDSIKGNLVMVSIASVAFFCQTSAYYGLTLWMSIFIRPWGVSPSLMLLLIALAEIPGLIVTSLSLKYFKSSRLLLSVNFGVASMLSLVIFLVNDSRSFIVSFCALYFCIVSIWTILYVHIPEGFPTLCRSRCFGIAGTFGKIGGILSPILFGWLFESSFQNYRLIIHLIISGLFLGGAISASFFKHK